MSFTGPLFSDENTRLPQHAFRNDFDTVACGPPVQPLDFPKPSIHAATFSTTTTLDARQGRLVTIQFLSRGGDSDHGYWIKRKLAQTAYGSVHVCVVLRRSGAEWTATQETVALKCSSWSKIRRKKGQHCKDPLKETACLQLIGNYHPNILGCLEVLQDETYLYTVMPYCSGGDLGSYIRKTNANHSNRKARPSDSPARSLASTHSLDPSYASTDTGSTSDQRRHEEGRARKWFVQLLQALQHLQTKGVSHRDINISNILLNGDTLVVTSFGLALRVPFMDRCNAGGIADVSEGGRRLLMLPQTYRGSRAFVAPEILERDAAVDGFAADLWSAGVLLFVFIVGLAPFKVPNATDRRFREINKGNLKELMALNLNETVSDAACDLLQNKLWRDPSKRLSLSQVLNHPWVVGHDTVTTVNVPATSPLSRKSTNCVPSRSDHGSAYRYKERDLHSTMERKVSF